MDPIKHMRLSLMISKLDKATGEKAKSLKMDEEAYCKERLDPIMNRVMEEVPKDVPKQLEMFRKAVGEEMWVTIAQNPSLPAIVSSHIENVKIDVLRDVKTTLTAELDGFMSEDDVNELFKLQFGI